MERPRPTKKQRETLTFIDNFITGHGYGPSYREIMSGLGYKSVSTVALHVDNLITKGYLHKRTSSARSLEVIGSAKSEFKTNTVKPAQEKWLVEQIDWKFAKVEAEPAPNSAAVDELYVLVGSLKVLGFDSAAQAFKSRLAKLRSRSQ